MKHLFISIAFFFIAARAFTQKPVVDTSLFGKWPSAYLPEISDDGKYASYIVADFDHHVPSNERLIVQATAGSYRVEIPVERSSAFLGEFNYVVFRKTRDSLGILRLGDTEIRYIPGVRSFNHAGDRNDEWLIYTTGNNSRELVISSLTSGEERKVKDVLDYRVKEDAKALVVICGQNRDSLETLYRVSLQKGIPSEKHWTGFHASNFVFSNDGSQLVFLGSDLPSKDIQRSIWSVGKSAGTEHILFNTGSWKAGNEWTITGIREFSPHRDQLFLSLAPKEKQTAVAPRQAEVKIWKYSDGQLLSQQEAQSEDYRQYAAVLNIKSGNLIPLEDKNRLMRSYAGAYALIEVRKQKYDEEEWHWNPACEKEYYLVSLNDGREKFLFPWKYPYSPVIDPSGKYIVYYDPVTANYLSYDILNSATYNITGPIARRWTFQTLEGADSVYEPIGPQGWIPEQQAILLHDQTDIWQIDLTGSKPPLNLTNGFGYRNNITFQLGPDREGTSFKPQQQVILSAFNRKTKDNGYYSITIGVARDPEKRTMGPYAYQLNAQGTYGFEVSADRPVKARASSNYILTRMSATAYPNYFFTKDFRTFTALTDFQPQKKVNWLSAELVEWQTPNGKTSQGILYKPENFDPQKKYPVIIHYYEKVSDGLNVFRRLEAAEGNINVPWMVSHGYLVFEPDIHYQPAMPGQSAYDHIVSGAKFLAAKPWVDKERMGLQGHSFGGYETNYVVTHSDLFKAACSAAGASNLIVQYGDIWASGRSKQSYSENSQTHMEATLWEKKEAYIENSPVFSSDKVSTPLLLVNNKKDGNVNYMEGFAFFLALRRLQKKAWLLEYEKSDHIIDVPDEALDFNEKLTQFFDHYLKGAPMPEWMK